MNKYLLTLGGLVLVLAVRLSFAPSVFAASMSLSPATASRAVGEEFSIDIVVDPEGIDSAGATAIIDYDKNLLQAESVTGASSGYGQELENTIDVTAGQIKYDAGALGSTVNSRTTLATIKFKALAAGTAEVNFVYDPNATINTSIVASADTPPTNLLETGNLNNGSYTISSSGSSGGSSSGTLPNSGVVEDTLMVLGGGSLLLVLGGFLARKALLGV